MVRPDNPSLRSRWSAEHCSAGPATNYFFPLAALIHLDSLGFPHFLLPAFGALDVGRVPPRGVPTCLPSILSTIPSAVASAKEEALAAVEASFAKEGAL